MPKKEKQIRLYDANGFWVEERGRVKGALRRAFRLHPAPREILNSARVELPPALKKDGTPGKKNQVRYRCTMCNELYPQKWVQVDHIIPAVRLHKKESEISYDEMVRGIFCQKENLQVLCSTPKKFLSGGESCHRIKTNEENFIRDRWQDFFKGGQTIRSEEDILFNEGKWRKEYEEYLNLKKIKLQEKEQKKQQRKLKQKNNNGNP
jgi:hypothetical protein